MKTTLQAICLAMTLFLIAPLQAQEMTIEGCGVCLEEVRRENDWDSIVHRSNCRYARSSSGSSYSSGYRRSSGRDFASSVAEGFTRGLSAGISEGVSGMVSNLIGSLFDSGPSRAERERQRELARIREARRLEQLRLARLKLAEDLRRMWEKSDEEMAERLSGVFDVIESGSSPEDDFTSVTLEDVEITPSTPFFGIPGNPDGVWGYREAIISQASPHFDPPTSSSNMATMASRLKRESEARRALMTAPLFAATPVGAGPGVQSDTSVVVLERDILNSSMSKEFFESQRVRAREVTHMAWKPVPTTLKDEDMRRDLQKAQEALRGRIDFSELTNNRQAALYHYGLRSLRETGTYDPTRDLEAALRYNPDLGDTGPTGFGFNIGPRWSLGQVAAIHDAEGALGNGDYAPDTEGVQGAFNILGHLWALKDAETWRKRYILDGN